MRGIHFHLIKEAHQCLLAFRTSCFGSEIHSIQIEILLWYWLMMLSRILLIPQRFILWLFWLICLFYIRIWNFKILFLLLISLLLLSPEEELGLLRLRRFNIWRYRIISTLLFEFFRIRNWGVLHIFFILDPIKMEILWLLSFIQAMRCTQSIVCYMTRYTMRWCSCGGGISIMTIILVDLNFNIKFVEPLRYSSVTCLRCFTIADPCTIDLL